MSYYLYVKTSDNTYESCDSNITATNFSKLIDTMRTVISKFRRLSIVLLEDQAAEINSEDFNWSMLDSHMRIMQENAKDIERADICLILLDQFASGEVASEDLQQLFALFMLACNPHKIAEAGSHGSPEGYAFMKISAWNYFISTMPKGLVYVG